MVRTARGMRDDETVPVSAPEIVRARTAVAVSFALSGFLFASWAARIPDVAANLRLTPGALGLTLLAGSAGSALTLPLSGWVTGHLGTARTVLTGSSLASVSVVLVGLSAGPLRSVPLTALFLFGTSVGIASWDVAMNVEGAVVERVRGRALMPRLHAGFSAGTVGGALVGTLATALHVPIAVHLGTVAAAVLATSRWSVRRFLPATADPSAAARPSAGHRAGLRHALSAWTERRTLLIGVIVLVAAFTEGTANDWLALSFVHGYALPTWAGTLAFAVFLSAMTGGRMLGTTLLDRFGRVRVVGATLSVAALGAVLVCVGPIPLAYLGTALWGVGASLGFPVGMSAAADDPARATARVGVVSSVGYVAFLAGPPLLGLLGDHIGVLRAITVVGVAAVPALLLLPALRPLPADEVAPA